MRIISTDERVRHAGMLFNTRNAGKRLTVHDEALRRWAAAEAADTEQSYYGMRPLENDGLGEAVAIVTMLICFSCASAWLVLCACIIMTVSASVVPLSEHGFKLRYCAAFTVVVQCPAACCSIGCLYAGGYILGPSSRLWRCPLPLWAIVPGPCCGLSP